MFLAKLFMLKSLKKIENILGKDFKQVRKKVKKVIDFSPKSVTLAQALEQQKKFNAGVARID